MSDNKETRIKDALYKPLTVDTRRGRGGTYGYVKWQAVADRMNDVFGMNWSSNVESQDIIGDQVIVRVSVCAKDPISSQLFCQEGYGGSEIRPSDEVGSAHKGAYSKALKDACKKWGIGLHLEEGEDSNFSSKPSGYSDHATAPTPSSQPMAKPIPAHAGNASMVPTMPTPQVEKPTVVIQKTPPVDIALPTNIVPIMPAPAPAPAPAQAPSAPAPAPAQAPSAPAPTTDTMSPDAPGTINSVQEMAIKNLARLSGIEDSAQLLTDLVNKDDTGLTRKITNLNDLSYTEAVIVIKAVKNLQ